MSAVYSNGGIAKHLYGNKQSTPRRARILTPLLAGVDTSKHERFLTA